jgi:hypothetical protein
VTVSSITLKEIAPILERAKQVAIDYYQATDKPLGVTGEVGEYEVARLLGLELASVRVPCLYGNELVRIFRI